MFDEEDEEPKGRILFRFKTNQSDNVTGNDDMPSECIVIEHGDAYAGLVVHGKSPRTGKWIVNWGERHVIRRLLEIKAGAFIASKGINKGHN